MGDEGSYLSLRILVCGGRAYSDWPKLCQILDTLLILDGIELIVHGDAPGADRMADNWAWAMGITTRPYRIIRGRESGFDRNRRMLSSEPDVDLVLAFPGGNGTADMVRRARRAGLEVREIP